MSRPILKYLREKGVICSAYLDDFIFISKTQSELTKHTNIAIKLLRNLGFTLNLCKSDLTPRHEITHLGFTLNSLDMSISLPSKKAESILHRIRLISNKKTCQIRSFARVIGTLVSIKPVVKYGWLHLKSLERVKHRTLFPEGNYNKIMVISNESKLEFKWWLNNIPNSKLHIGFKHFDMEIYSDASNTGWGAYCKNKKTHGFWNLKEKQLHINCLELIAAFNALKCFLKNTNNKNILLRIDNTTAIATINKMGSIQHTKLNNISKEIWNWCESKNIFIQASYISSTNNTIADSESRIKNMSNEFELKNTIFRQITNIFGSPNIDLFATYQNKKCNTFISWHPDPESMCVDAFTIDWEPYFFYAFPPFQIIGKVLDKIVHDKATGILVVPDWPSQFWYPRFKELLTDEPLKFQPFNEIVISHFRPTDPLQKTTLVVGKLSGSHSYTREPP